MNKNIFSPPLMSFRSQILHRLVATALLAFGLINSGTAAFAYDAGTKAGAPLYKTSSVFVSDIKESAIPFTGLVAKWHMLAPEGTSAELFARFRASGVWTEWNEIHGDIDGIEEASAENPVAYISTSLATAYQYKVVLGTNDPTVTPLLENIEFTYIHARDAQKMSASLEPRAAFFAGDTVAKSDIQAKTSGVSAIPPVKIISRSDWGADESLRLFQEDRPEAQVVKLESDFATKYKNELKIARTVSRDPGGKDLTWPLAYPEKISKIIIHHTATTKNLDDPKQAIRDIYYYHTISRGWGDIGYNYIIDPKGNIYEGRFGGEGVVGAHAGRANVGSIGIAVLGNYQDKEVPEPVLNALAALIKAKSMKYGINPSGSSSFRGENLANVIGHRDVMSTSCPGQKLYDKMPTVISLAKDGMKMQVIDKRRAQKNTKQAYDFAVSGQIESVDLDAGGQTTATIKLKNTGTQEWTKDTYLGANADPLQGYVTDPGKVNSSKLSAPVKPGAEGTFKVTLNAGKAGGYTNLEFFLLIGGKTKVEKYLIVPLHVASPTYDYELVSLKVTKKYLKRGESTEAYLTLKNTGNMTWFAAGKNKIMIGTENTRDHISRIIERPGARLGGLVDKEVKPGETGTFKIRIKAPTVDGYYREYFAPVVEGITWLPYRQNYLEIYVSNASHAAIYSGTGDMGTFLPKEKKKVVVEFENTGRGEWKKSGFSAEISKSPELKVTPGGLTEDSVLPGQTGKLELTVEAPATEGNYRVNLMPKVGSTKLLARPVPLLIIVSKTRKSEPSVAGTTVNTGSVRVAVSFKGEPALSASSTFKLFDGSKSLGSFRMDEKVKVTYSQGKYMVKGDKLAFALTNAPRFVPDGGIMRIDNYENRPSWKPELNDNTYRGALEVHWYENALVVVNELPIEDYLKGLAEISATEQYEKIKAIIILARSYTKYYTSGAKKFPGAPFDLTDDPERSQKYLGYGFEIRNFTGVKAVKDTLGKVVTYNGKVIKTPYFSSDDGRTRSAEEVWGWTDTPYLVSVDDPGCKGKTLNGHGVGMSGCGAQYFASQGKKAEEIIQYYFKGVKVEKL